MAKRSATQIYRQLTAAGFDAASAVVMTAIALAESGGSDTARGDTSLVDATWGPSYGLYQIRTLKGQTGTGTDRDIAWLSGSDSNQAAAALAISHGGATFAPWTTYTSGAYAKFLGQAEAAASAGSAAPSPSTGSTTPATQASWGPSWLPWNWPGDIAGGVRSAGTDLVAQIGGLALTAVFVIGGVGLVVAGVIHLARPARIEGLARDTAALAAV